LSSLPKISVSIFFIFLHLCGICKDLHVSYVGASEAGMSYACMMKQSFWNSFNNPASLAFNKSFSTGFNYENRFLIKELSTRSVALIIPAGKPSYGAIYSKFGYSDFSREFIGIACGMKLSEIISAGVQIDYFNEKTSVEYSKYQTITFDAGLIISASEKTAVGLHIFNPVPNSLRRTCFPSIINLGIGTHLSETLYTGAEIEICTGDKLVFRTGFDYNVFKNIWLRSGYCTNNNSFSFGSGFYLNNILSDISFSTNNKLGITSSVSFIIVFKKKP
jgi:hypothetical protein